MRCKPVVTILLGIFGMTLAFPLGAQQKPMNQVEIFSLLAGQVMSRGVTLLVQERGIDFEPQEGYLQAVRLAGGEDELIRALRSAKVAKPVAADPAAQAQQREIRQHVARGAQSLRESRYLDAEVEYREALRLNPNLAEAHHNLGVALEQKGDRQGALAEYRAAYTRDPQEATYKRNYLRLLPSAEK